MASCQQCDDDEGLGPHRVSLSPGHPAAVAKVSRAGAPRPRADPLPPAPGSGGEVPGRHARLTRPHDPGRLGSGAGGVKTLCSLTSGLREPAASRRQPQRLGNPVTYGESELTTRMAGWVSESMLPLGYQGTFGTLFLTT